MTCDEATTLRNRLFVALAELNWSVGLVKASSSNGAFDPYRRAAAHLMGDVSGAISWVFAQDSSLEPTPEQWKGIVEDLLRESPPRSRSEVGVRRQIAVALDFVDGVFAELDRVASMPVAVRSALTKDAKAHSAAVRAVANEYWPEM